MRRSSYACFPIEQNINIFYHFTTASHTFHKLNIFLLLYIGRMRSICYNKLHINVSLTQAKSRSSQNGALPHYKPFPRLSVVLSCRWGRRGGSHSKLEEKIKATQSTLRLIWLYIIVFFPLVDILRIKVSTYMDLNHWGERYLDPVMICWTVSVWNVDNGLLWQCVGI